MRKWSSHRMRSFTAATGLFLMVEKILLNKRETHFLECERLGGGETSQLLLVIGDTSAKSSPPTVGVLEC